MKLNDDNFRNLQPLITLKAWLSEAEKLNLTENSAMTLSTYNQDGPSSRIVLLKQITPQGGLVFFTNYNSPKAQEALSSKKVALNFHWDGLLKQICIKGEAQKTSRSTSEDYWSQRSKQSQLSQFVSAQSTPLDSRNTLESLYQQASTDFSDKTIPCPDHWGGIEVTPTSYEFWQAHPHRLHDRFLYQWIDNKWQSQRLFP